MKTLNELVTQTEEELLKQVEFFKSLNILMPGGVPATEEDLVILAKCLDVYQTTGVNHFPRYRAFYNVRYNGLSNQSCKTFETAVRSGEYTYEMYKEDVECEIDGMTFFEIEDIDGVPKEFLEESLLMYQE